MHWWLHLEQFLMQELVINDPFGTEVVEHWRERVFEDEYLWTREHSFEDLGFGVGRVNDFC